MIRYDTKPFLQVPTMVGQIAAMQSFWPKAEYQTALKRLAAHGAYITRCMEGHRLIGSMTTAPVTRYGPVLARRTELEAETKVTLENCIVRSTIHLRDGWEGQRVGTEVDRLGREYAKAQGYTHSLCWGYATAEVFSWLSSQKAAQVLSVLDHTEQPFILTPL